MKEWSSDQSIALAWTAYTLDHVVCCKDVFEKDAYTGEATETACGKKEHHGYPTCDSIRDKTGQVEYQKLPCHLMANDCLDKVGHKEMRVVTDADEVKKFMDACPVGRCGEWKQSAATTDDKINYFISSNSLKVWQGIDGLWVASQGNPNFGSYHIISGGRSQLEAISAAHIFIAHGWEVGDATPSAKANSLKDPAHSAWVVGPMVNNEITAPVAEGTTWSEATISGMAAAATQSTRH